MQRRPELFRFHDYSVDKVLRQGSPHKARILRAWRDDQVYVLKDISQTRAFFRLLYGRRSLAREVRVMERLQGTGLVPTAGPRLGPDAIAFEFVQTGRCKNYLRKKIGRKRMSRVLATLGDAVTKFHAAGFLHFDLRQRKNILVHADDRIVLIDFESSRRVGTGWFGQRVLVPLFGRIDRGAVLKWRSRFLPESLSEQERRTVDGYSHWRRLWPAKRIGRWLRGCFQGRDRSDTPTTVGEPLAGQGGRSTPE